MTVLTFAERRPVGGRVRRGTLLSVDPTIREARVTGGEGGGPCCVGLDVSDAVLDPLHGLVSGGDARVLRVECDFEEERDGRGRATALHLVCDAALLADRLSRGGVRGEEMAVLLARAAWREGRVADEGEEEDEEDEEDEGDVPPLWRGDEYPLFPHQRRTLAWMRGREAAFPSPLSYDGNLRLGRGWYLDLEAERFSREADPRVAHLVGGLCADGTGSGKTATALRLVAETCRAPLLPPSGGSRHASSATLVILPLNLLSQWQGEVRKFLVGARVLTLVAARDLRGVTLASLCEEYDLVLTTFYFLRSCKAYLELVDSALGNRPRTRASLAAWARMPNHAAPVLEAVWWRRVVVDEMHELSPRDVRSLRLFDAASLWGLTATPGLDDAERARHLLPLFLAPRERSAPDLPPTLLARLASVAVRAHAPLDFGRLARPREDLHLVRLSAEERLHALASFPEEDSLRDLVRACTFVDEEADAGEGETAEEWFRSVRARGLAGLRARAEELAREVDLLATRAPEALRHATAARDEAFAALARREEADRLVDDRLASGGACSSCGLPRSARHLASCSHLLCDACAGEARGGGSCPACGLSLLGVVAVDRVGGIGTKMRDIVSLLRALPRGEPVLLFVQWKTMARGTRSVLRGAGVRVLQLDGNAAQRAATLSEFARGRESSSPCVLLLCLDDHFAGLHLPHVRHVLFAHALVGDYSTVRRLETQAVARCLRHGQTSPDVRVHSFVVADCAEEGLWRATRG